MSTTIVMPQLGESVAEGVIGKWLKQEGDQIERDEPIVEVITDKVNAEIPSPVAGVLEKITQPEGATVAVGQEIAIIGDGGGSGQQEPAQAGTIGGDGQQESGRTLAPSAVEAGSGARVEAAPAQAAAGIGAATEPAQAGSLPEGGQSGQVGTARPADRGTNGRGDRVRSSPLVRRLAEQYGIDLAAVPGTGIGGRVSKQDIMSFIEQKQQAAPAAVATQAPPALPQAPARASSPAVPSPVPARQLGPGEELVPVSPVRKMIADRMTLSKSTIPHATTIVEVDVTNLVRYREAKKEEFRRQEGVPLSYVAFMIKATVDALKAYPMVNAEWRDEGIVLKKDININVAVDAPDGLTTPVIHRADQKSLAGLSVALADLAERARDRRLKIEDMQGGTFTVNNTGALDSIWSMSIINYPQGGILAFAAIVKRPVVIEQDGQDLIAVRHMMNVSFSFDHRLLDGGYAAGFLNAVKQNLESWTMEYPLY